MTEKRLLPIEHFTLLKQTLPQNRSRAAFETPSQAPKGGPDLILLDFRSQNGIKIEGTPCHHDEKSNAKTLFDFWQSHLPLTTEPPEQKNAEGTPCHQDEKSNAKTRFDFWQSHLTLMPGPPSSKKMPIVPPVIMTKNRNRPPESHRSMGESLKNNSKKCRDSPGFQSGNSVIFIVLILCHSRPRF